MDAKIIAAMAIIAILAGFLIFGGVGDQHSNVGATENTTQTGNLKLALREVIAAEDDLQDKIRREGGLQFNSVVSVSSKDYEKEIVSTHYISPNDLEKARGVTTWQDNSGEGAVEYLISYYSGMYDTYNKLVDSWFLKNAGPIDRDDAYEFISTFTPSEGLSLLLQESFKDLGYGKTQILEFKDLLGLSQKSSENYACGQYVCESVLHRGDGFLLSYVKRDDGFITEAEIVFAGDSFKIMQNGDIFGPIEDSVFELSEIE